MSLVVDPDVFAVAADAFGAAAQSCYVACAGPVDARVGMAGDDPSGGSWALCYDTLAAGAVGLAETVINASFHLAGLLQHTGVNYAAAEAASAGWPAPPAPGGSDWTLRRAFLPAPTPVAAGSYARSAVVPPVGWDWVGDLVDGVWPNGHQDQLHAAARGWRSAAAAISQAAADIGFVDGQLAVLHTPDTQAAATACTAMRGHLQELAGLYAALAQACDDYAHAIDVAHAQIRSVLAELLAETIAIQVAGGLLSVVTFGLAEAAAQAAETWRLLAAAARISAALDRFAVITSAGQARLAGAGTGLADRLAGLARLLGTEPVPAGGAMIPRTAHDLTGLTRIERVEMRAQSRLAARAARAERQAKVRAANNPDDTSWVTKYENPGHHDLAGGPNNYNSGKSVIPKDAKEQFANSIDVDGVRWTKIGTGRKAIYYRYARSNGYWHWNGSTAGSTARGGERNFPIHKVPAVVRNA